MLEANWNRSEITFVDEQLKMYFQVALVGQEPGLLNRSIKYNIAYGLDYWDDMMVQRAAEVAQAHRFISSLKDGYDTAVGEKGQNLSGTVNNHERS